MSQAIEHVANANRSSEWSAAVAFGVEQAEQARAFHASFPTYQPTPLRRLDALARKLGLAALFVKDESARFGLNAFKGLGGSYCVGQLLAERAGIPQEDLTFDRLQRRDIREIAEGLTLVTATDGNHGRGVAWAAREFGAKAVVYLPKGSSLERLRNIQLLGAQAQIVDYNYDDAVRFAARQAEEQHWVLVQDTAWEGYGKIPTQIMRGYTTLAAEAVEQLEGELPTHVFLQAGVGAMSGAVTAFLAHRYRQDKPIITIVEPNAADCVFRTAAANDGTLHTVGGNLETIMAGLACGEPCPIGWDMLQRFADHFVSVPDEIAEQGMRILAHPEGDEPIVSGESGAVTTGLVARIMADESLGWLRESIGLDSTSKVLCISTEGDTDRASYQRIVEGGY